MGGMGGLGGGMGGMSGLGGGMGGGLGGLYGMGGGNGWRKCNPSLSPWASQAAGREARPSGGVGDASGNVRGSYGYRDAQDSTGWWNTQPAGTGSADVTSQRTRSGRKRKSLRRQPMDVQKPPAGVQERYTRPAGSCRKSRLLTSHSGNEALEIPRQENYQYIRGNGAGGMRGGLEVLEEWEVAWEEDLEEWEVAWEEDLEEWGGGMGGGLGGAGGMGGGMGGVT
ncbi:hypothetical protein CEXT_697811 [Caerostris extrusa]|uniref:Uncharacterized protein n=1 Tax=Caerostris extrusa TaxID=172846 RepID=A0AAV4ULX9_CAEEX|nr:hypothetical protein CEXT_697811 [Caerostris extrusa]